jgi:osmoprotectant transport system ATP-binding protein
MVTHDLAEAGWFGDEIILLRAGRIVQSGPLQALLDEPAEPFVTQFVSAQRQVRGLSHGGAA